MKPAIKVPKAFHFTEEQIQRQVCNYLKTNYPEVLFRSDIAGFNFSKEHRKRIYSLRSGRGFPDLTIYEPNEKYKALFIELKADDVKIIRPDGEISSNEHIQEQVKILEKLQSKGYYTAICIGYEACVEVIKKYMNNEL